MKRRKQHLTLIEIMIVIVLIGLIGSVVAYNMRGSLDEGKVFKTEQGGAQVYNILLLEVARGNEMDEVATNWKEHVRRSSLARKPESLLKDGWGSEYVVEYKDDDIKIHSEKFDTIAEKKGRETPVYFQ